MNKSTFKLLFATIIVIFVFCCVAQSIDNDFCDADSLAASEVASGNAHVQLPSGERAGLRVLASSGAGEWVQLPLCQLF